MWIRTKFILGRRISQRFVSDGINTKKSFSWSWDGQMNRDWNHQLETKNRIRCREFWSLSCSWEIGDTEVSHFSHSYFGQVLLCVRVQDHSTDCRACWFHYSFLYRYCWNCRLEMMLSIRISMFCKVCWPKNEINKCMTEKMQVLNVSKNSTTYAQVGAQRTFT